MQSLICAVHHAIRPQCYVDIDLSGFNKINYELRRSRKGKLYRWDKIELSIGSAASDWIDVNIREITFTNIPRFSGSKQGLGTYYGGGDLTQDALYSCVKSSFCQNAAIGGGVGDYDSQMRTG